MRTIRIASFALIMALPTLQGQQPALPGTFWSREKIAADIEKGVGTLGVVAGQSVTIYPGVAIRKRLDGPNNASVHSADVDQNEVDEITYILDGSGTFVTGGLPPDPNDRTKGITGGEAHDVKAGDAIVVPAGTPHWFRKINGHVTMLEIRIPSARSQKKPL
jgi:mannose-6-phosphate isomerase-like protein (cupin superfamily)